MHPFAVIGLFVANVTALMVFLSLPEATPPDEVLWALFVAAVIGGVTFAVFIALRRTWDAENYQFGFFAGALGFYVFWALHLLVLVLPDEVLTSINLSVWTPATFIFACTSTVGAIAVLYIYAFRRPKRHATGEW